MLGLAHHGRIARELAARPDQLQGIQRLAAGVALVAPGILIAAVRAGALDITVGQKALALLAVEGLHRLPDHIAAL